MESCRIARSDYVRDAKQTRTVTKSEASIKEKSHYNVLVTNQTALSFRRLKASLGSKRVAANTDHVCASRFVGSSTHRGSSDQSRHCSPHGCSVMPALDYASMRLPPALRFSGHVQPRNSYPQSHMQVFEMI